MANNRGKPDSNLSRRKLLKAVGLGAAGSTLPPLVRSASAREAEDSTFRLSTDVVVVGSGAAGLSAAMAANASGARVIVLEKGAFVGGTTRKSGGIYWIPHNRLMRAEGLTDPRPDAIRYMARLAYPQLYNPGDVRLGLPRNEFNLIATFYDEASPAVEFLKGAGALQFTFYRDFAGNFFPDYFAELSENKAPRGRGLQPVTPDGALGSGSELIRQLETAATIRGVKIRLNVEVTKVVLSPKGRVIGVMAGTSHDDHLFIRARRGVVFASGGFGQEPALRRTYLRGPVYSGCAVAANKGDLIGIAGALGVQLANLNEAWFHEVVLEESLALGEVPLGVFFNAGDSMLTVDKFGRRVANEKSPYNERARVHFVWDPVSAEYRNLLLFFLYDQRTAELFDATIGGPIPSGNDAPFVLSGRTLTDLAVAIRARLEALAGDTGGFQLDASFEANLHETVATFNGYAERGVDEDFRRGETLAEIAFHGPRQPDNDKPNSTMFPLSSTGPYYCIILAASTLDTRGGPKIDAQARFLDFEGKPIPGIYGAGNCIASPAGQAYWAPGGTLGPAMTFGFIAGRSAARGE